MSDQSVGPPPGCQRSPDPTALAYLAQTGHILKVKNRPDNVHDSKGAVNFLRDLIDGSCR